MGKTTPRVKSADRVLDIFELFTGDQDAYTLTDIAKSLNMPPSSTYQLLKNMLNRGYLESDQTGKYFSLGHKLFEIRAQHRKRTSMTAEFFKVASKIVEDINEVVLLGIRSGDKVVYVAEKQVNQPFRFSTNLGSVLPLYTSASGKILLCQLSEKELIALYPQGRLKKYTNNTISSVAALKVELEKVRKEGVAYNLEESVDGMNCIAGPIFNMEGAIVASVSITIPVIRCTDQLWDQTQRWIQRACAEISNKVFRQN